MKSPVSRIVRLAIVLLAAFVNAFSQTTLPPGASISGRVTIKDKPAAGITVVLTRVADRGTLETVAQAVTNADGNYLLSNVRPGALTVSVVGGSYVLEGANTSAQTSKTVTVSDEEAIPGIDFKLLPGGVITGRVTDTSGRPVVEYRVELQLIESSGRKRAVAIQTDPRQYTDDRGIYRIFGLRPGRYTVSVGEAASQRVAMLGSGRTYLPRTFHPDVTDEARATVVEVSENGEAKNIDIRIGPRRARYVASGRVVDAETGEPVVGAIMAVGNPERGSNRLVGFSVGAMATDSNGRFELNPLDPGRYGTFVLPGFRSDEYYSDAAFFDLVDDDLDGLEVKRFRGASISGVVDLADESDSVLRAAIASLKVGTFSTENSPLIPMGSPNSSINPDRTFRIGGVRPGRASIIVFTLAGQAPVSIVLIEHDGAPVTDGINITQGLDITGVRVVVGRGTGGVRGTVKLEGGVLPPGTVMQVVALGVPGTRLTTRAGLVDDRGRFHLENLLAGEYVLSLSFRTSIGDTVRPGVGQNVSVTNGATTETTFVVNLAPSPEEEKR